MKKSVKVLISILIFTVFLFIFIVTRTEEIFIEEHNELNSEQIEEKTQGITYYVSSQGTSTEGTDINSPMSLSMAKTKKYSSNDKILLKCGDTFYEQVAFNIDADSEQYCIISSYGDGHLPIIDMSKIVSDANACEKYSNGIYKIDLSNQNNFEGYSEKNSTSCNIGFFIDNLDIIYGNRKSSLNELIDEYDFYCDQNSIYIKCDENPITKLGTLKFAMDVSAVRVSSNAIYENLNIMNTGVHGISRNNTNLKNCIIRSCIIENIGGSVYNKETFTRYGNGIEFWNEAENTLVEKCIIKNTYDAGYTIQGNTSTIGFKNNICRDNIFIGCTYDVELFSYYKENNVIAPPMINSNISNNISINQGKGWGYIVRKDKDPSSVLVLWGDNSISDHSNVELKNNVYWNSRNLFYVYKNNMISKDKYAKIINSDNNKIYYSEDTSFFRDDNVHNEKEILEEYKQDQHSEFNLLSEEEISKINNDEILKSKNYDEIKAYYENLEKEFGYEGLLNELLNKYKELETNVTNNDVLTKVAELKTMIQNKQNDDKLLTQAEIKDLFDLHYDMIKVISQENSAELIDITNKLNEFEEIYYKLFNLSKADISYNKDLLRNKIENAKKIIEDNEEIQTDLFSELITIIQKYYDDSDSSINGLICNKLLDVFYSYAYKNVKVYITYSEMNITNKDVVAILESDIPIEMNMPNTHTFTENGSFTFKFVLNGEEKELTATVDWIDKKAPVITGYENRIDELEAVVINVTDENLNKIVVLKDGEQIDFNNGDTLFRPGNYQILATDKAGNSSEVTLRIVDYIESNKTYYISNNGEGDGLSEDSPMNINQASKTRFYAGDKILFKAGEKYKLRLDWVMMGSPNNKVVISSYGQGDRPIIDGYISLVSNLEISNLYFVNDKESSIVTNQEFSENIVISDCIFQDIVDTGIYLNRQIKNCEIKDCIFRNCTNGISMKNDFQNLLLTEIKIHDNIFISGTKAIVISGKNENEVFEKVEIYNNIFMNYTSNGSSIISFGFIEDTKFDVTIYNNVYYNFLRVYSIDNEYYENFKNNVRSDSNTFYSFNDSKFIGNSTNFDDLNNSYNIDKESKNIVMDVNRYKVSDVTNMANNSLDKNEIIDYMNQTISASSSGQSNNGSSNNNNNNNNGSGMSGIEKTPTVTTSQLANKNSQKATDKTMSQEKIPYTGTEKIIVVAIASLIIMGLFSGINYGKYLKDTRKQFKK